MKHFIFFLLACLIGSKVLACTARQDTVPTFDTCKDVLPDQIIEGQRQALKKQTGDRKDIFPSLINGIGSFTSNAGSSLVLKPTLWGLSNIGNSKDSANYSTKRFQKSYFAQNLQFYLSLSPENNSNFKFDSLSFGLSYALLNNTVLKAKQYKILDTLTRRANQIQVFLQTQTIKRLSDAQIECIIHSNYADSSIPDTLVKEIKKRFGINGRIQDALDYKSVVTHYLEKAPVWTISIIDNYNPSKTLTNNLVASTNVSFGLFPIHNAYSAFSVSAYYKWQNDTLRENANLNRKLFYFGLGLNFPVCSIFEIKPAASFLNINGPLYSKESTNSINGSLTLRLKLNDELWLPLSLEYTPNSGQFFGFLSIQYSL
jgi:hypothetical protein